MRILGLDLSRPLNELLPNLLSAPFEALVLGEAARTGQPYDALFIVLVCSNARTRNATKRKENARVPDNYLQTYSIRAEDQNNLYNSQRSEE